MELKQVYGYEGLYLVSNTGKVFSEVFRNNKAVFKRRKELKLNSNGHGYLYISLSKNGAKKRVYVHRLVAEHFLGQPPEGAVVNHKDHDRSNNNASNLEWVSQAENVKYSALLMAHPKSKCKPTNTGEKYISLQKSGKSKYMVRIKKLNINKFFETLEEAVAFRNQILGKW